MIVWACTLYNKREAGLYKNIKNQPRPAKKKCDYIKESKKSIEFEIFQVRGTIKFKIDAYSIIIKFA